MFAAMHWWRGSFWMMAPLMLVFAGVAYWKIPDRLSQEAERNRFAGVPFLATLAPSATKRLTVASPIPDAPPVTAAILPSSLPMFATFH
jgi:hypothetical protein